MKLISSFFVVLLFSLVACQTADPAPVPEVSEATPTLEIEPTAVPPTTTPIPPTVTPIPPTETSEPPTAIPEPATSTPEPPTPTPEPALVLDDILGKWALSLFTLSINSDGSYEVVWPAEEGEGPHELGVYEFDGRVITFTPESYEPGPNALIEGCEGLVYSYQVSFPDDSRFMSFSVGDDPCDYRDFIGWASTTESWQQLEKYTADAS